MTDEQRELVQAAVERVQRLEEEVRREVSRVAEALGDEQLRVFVGEHGGRSSSDSYYEAGCETFTQALDELLRHGGPLPAGY